MSAHIEGRLAVHPTFPNTIVPEGHIERPIGGAADAAREARDYAAIVARAPEDRRHHRFDHEANARRLVACWNACVGLPTEHIEQSKLVISVSQKGGS